jgi:hypothetical protein
VTKYLSTTTLTKATGLFLAVGYRTKGGAQVAREEKVNGGARTEEVLLEDRRIKNNSTHQPTTSDF